MVKPIEELNRAYYAGTWSVTCRIKNAKYDSEDPEMIESFQRGRRHAMIGEWLFADTDLANGTAFCSRDYRPKMTKS